MWGGSFQVFGALLLGSGQGMHLWGLWYRDLGPPSVNPDIHLSRGTQCLGFGGQR